MKEKTLLDFENYNLKLERVEVEAKDTYTFYFEKPESLFWKEGDHTHFFMPNKEIIRENVRHFSFATMPYEDTVAITTRLRGELSEFKEYLQGMKIGDLLGMAKVGGEFTLVRKNKPVILISQGVGIATMRPIIVEFGRDNEGVEALQSLNIDSSGDYIYEELMEVYNKEIENFYHKYVNNREEFYQKIDFIIENNGNKAYYYIVGSDLFMDSVSKYLNERKIYNLILDTHNNNHPDYQ